MLVRIGIDAAEAQRLRALGWSVGRMPGHHGHAYFIATLGDLDDDDHDAPAGDD